MRREIVIRGAGPVGCVVALLLGKRGRSAVVQERAAPGARPAGLRPIAHSHASRLILAEAGAWDGLAPTEIGAVHVSQAAAFGRTLMSARDAGVPALGYVLDYTDLADALAGAVRAAGIEIVPEAEGGAALTVHAEGASDGASEKRSSRA
jgi:2-octaprenyl-6-methoxyphenol hydroxylase